MINFKIIFIAGLLGLVVGWQNVAFLTNGTTCTASAQFDGDHTCHEAIDGYLWFDKLWAVRDQGIGIWIQVTFDNAYVLTYGRIMQMFARVQQNRKIRMSFDGGSSVEKYLMKRRGDRYESYAGQAWDEFSLDHIWTSFVRIIVVEVYTSVHNGFNELEFYTGSNPCQMQYTFLQGRCYRVSAGHRTPWLEARAMCQRERGDLAHIGDEAEMTSVLQWLQKVFHFDANLWVSNYDVTVSSPKVEEGLVGNVVLHKPGGSLAYVTDDTNFYICETPILFTELMDVSPDDDTALATSNAFLEASTTVPTTDFDDGSATTLIVAKMDRIYAAMVVVLPFCVIIFVALMVIIALGGYQFYKLRKKCEPPENEYEDVVRNPTFHTYANPESK